MISCEVGNDSQVTDERRASRRSRTSMTDVAKASEAINADLMYGVPLIPVDCRFGIVKEQPDQTQALKSVIQRQRRAGGCKVTVLFAIRRPGCGNCREHGRQLTEINGLERDVSFVGAMKHGSGVDDAALLDFYQQYYRFPLYKDKDWKIYTAMGGRKISVFKLLSSIPRLEARYKKKGIPNIPFGGDIWTKGGIMIFDREGNLRHTFYEKYGEELEIDKIRAAIQQARAEPEQPRKQRDRRRSDASAKTLSLDSSCVVSLGHGTSSTDSGSSLSDDGSDRIGAVEPLVEQEAATVVLTPAQNERTALSADAANSRRSSSTVPATPVVAVVRRKSGRPQISKQQKRTNKAHANRIREGLAIHQEKRRASMSSTVTN